MIDQKIEAIELVAEGINERLKEFVFIGGIVVEMYASGNYPDEVRPTMDVDCVIHLTSISQQEALDKYLRSKGFKNDSESGIICRWLYKEIYVDIMPTISKILGFSNQWYKTGFNHTFPYFLPSTKQIRLFKPPYFFATKLEAALSRGQKDYRINRDFEDLIYLLDNRNELPGEIHSVSRDLQNFVKSGLQKLKDNPTFLEGIYAALPYSSRDGRTSLIIEKIDQMTS